MNAIVVPSAIPTQIGETSQATEKNATSSKTTSEMRRRCSISLVAGARWIRGSSRSLILSELRETSLGGGVLLPLLAVALTTVRAPLAATTARAATGAGVAEELESSSLMKGPPPA